MNAERGGHFKEAQGLEQALGNMVEIAHEFGLDPYPTHFEIVPSQVINEVGAYGIPGRYSHWTYGRTYRQLKTTYDHGLQRIYEVVINGNPSLAFLLENNEPIVNKMVMAHVLGHTDFFKRNYLFRETPKDMVSRVARHASQIKEYVEQEGELAVEQFLDATLAIEDHIDPQVWTRPAKAELIKTWKQDLVDSKKPKNPGEYDDLFRKTKTQPEQDAQLKIPPQPDKDVLGFIRDFAPYLEDWQRGIIDIVRSESLYFYPQIKTKIMNEGWATYWHKRIMREMAQRGHISTDEDTEWWGRHASVALPIKDRLNPYYFGMKMFEYLEDYYNGNLEEKETRWLKEEGYTVYPKYDGQWEKSPGLAKIIDIVSTENDQAFIRNNFTKVVADRLDMYVYEQRGGVGVNVKVVAQKGWEMIRKEIVSSMDNAGIPYITVGDGDYNHQQELYLQHLYEGKELDQPYLEKTLPYIYKLWGRPVHLETVVNGNRIVFSYPL